MHLNTLSGLRFPLVTYVYVRSRREIRALLVLLASLRFTVARISVLRFPSVMYVFVHSCRHTRRALNCSHFYALRLRA